MGKTSSNNIGKEFGNLRNKLLDLTLRNQLLNFKPRSKTIEVVNQSPLSIYQTLILQKKKMQFVPKKRDIRSNSSSNEENSGGMKSRFSALWEHPPIDLSIFSEGDKSLKADLTPSELQKRLFYINQQARTMLQEQGYNILYLAIGFLEWRDNIKPKEVHAAPLILIPVSMKRKKVGKSFSICWNEEDIQTNISLQAKLAEEGIILPEFKITSYIGGVEHYLRDVRNAVSKMKDWKVTNHISMGFFSFTKFVMYNDLNPESWEENVDLTKHELIESIFNPSKNKHTQSFNEEDIDKELLYKDMYQVLDADSSQIAAIEDVKAGRNLVVEGPPGTGKSQTIVNLIAELLASGKSVLFVSEKMAALEVVKSRLDGVGLGKFVLELHSHKTRRKKLLKELQKALNVRAMDDININQVLRKLETLRHQLDDYADVLHQPLYGVKLSPFELYGMKESADDHFSKKKTILPLVRFKSPDNYTIKDLDDIIISLENLAELNSTIAKNNPWSNCSPKSLFPSDLREIEMVINDTLDALDEFNLESQRLFDLYGIKPSINLRNYKKSLESLKLLDGDNTKLIDSTILTNRCWIDDPRKANILVEKLENYQMTVKFMNKFNEIIITEDLDTIIKDLEKSVNKKFKLFGGKNYKKELNYLYKSEVPKDKTALNEIKAVQEHLKFKKEFDKLNDLGVEYFGDLWHLNASIVDLKEFNNWIIKFNHLLKEGIYSETTISLLPNELFDIDSNSEINDYISSGEKFTNKLSKLESKLNPRSKLIFKKETIDVPFDKWEEQLKVWRGQISSLHLWSQYLNTKNKCLSSPAELFVSAVEKRNIKKEDVKPLVMGNFADSLLNIVFSENTELTTFIGELHQNKISEFKDLDSKIIELNRRRIFQKLNKNIPQVFGAAENPEAKTLAGEFTRKRGHLPVRKLLEKSGGLVKQIKPCFMMSPLSIAQYLDPNNPKLQFDVVIFDEASQVKPEDALGAFMRAKTAVVMGDTQQLPPTSFFDQMTGIDTVEEVATALDMESILHLCKLSFPVKMLKWHYRSRHESLIAVSNKEFYDNELLVYPSPSHNTGTLGLKFRYNSHTVYERGKSSANPLEAKEVVKSIFEHFNKYGDTKSLGVGTFSVAQMNAILEELEIERKQHPELEPLFSDKMKESFFVKNLETIQGDERDVILISVGYGYDQERKMSLNFGPLNQDGGERRLNVLITRAREKCVVFSNFKAHDMHLSNNPPFGVKALKEFLEYAENISRGNIIKRKDSEEPFTDAVYTFLVENNYKVDKKVGCAGFRVDLAIIDENNPGRYIVGIECDGKMYSSSKVARDRDRLREQILNGLGWNLYHLWSTDWYRNRDLAREKLLASIERIKAEAFIEEVKAMEIKKIEVKDDGLTIVNPIDDEDPDNFKHENSYSSEDLIENIDNIVDNTIDNRHNGVDNYNKQKDDIFDDEEETIAIEDLDSILNSENDIDKNSVEISKINKENDPINDMNAINQENGNESISSIEFDTDDTVNNNNNPNINEKDYIKKDNDENIANFEDNTNNNINNNNNAHNSDNNNNYINNLIQNSKNIKNNVSGKFDNFKKQKTTNQLSDKGRNNESNELFAKLDDNIENNLINEAKNEKTIHKVKFRSNLDVDFKKNDLNRETTNPEENSDNINNKDYDDLEEEINKVIGNSTIIDSNNKDKDTIINSNDYNNDNSNFNNKEKENYKTKNIDILNENTLSESSESINETENVIIDELDGINTYEGVSSIDNPLRKNNVFHKKSNPKDYNGQNLKSRVKSVTESISEIKNEVKYINKSLKEIENPTAPKNVVVIDRTENIHEEENQPPCNKNFEEMNSSNRDNSNDSLNYNKNKRFDDSKTTELDTINYPININKNSHNTSNDLNNNLNNSNYSNEVNVNNVNGDNLDNIIENLNDDYVKIEKERNKESNILKPSDNRKTISKNTSMEDLVVPYEIANNIPITNTNDLYNMPNNEISNIIKVIILFEGPIHINDLVVRIKESSNTKRAVPKFKNSIKKAVSLAEENGFIINIEDFLFPQNWSTDKISVRKRIKPNIDLIANEEIERNIKLVLSFINPIDPKKLTKEVAKNFGFKSTSKKTATRINTVIDYMIVNRIIANVNNEIELIKNY